MNCFGLERKKGYYVLPSQTPVTSSPTYAHTHSYTYSPSPSPENIDFLRSVTQYWWVQNLFH